MSKKNKLELTYISSAITSFARASSILESAKKIGKEKEYHGLMQDILYRLDEYSEHCGHGTLWNSITEKSNKKILQSLTDKNKKKLLVLTDSGGLQIVTLGISVSPEQQIESYQRQAEYSTHALNMDSMPVLVNEKLRDKFSSKGGGGQGLKLNHSIKYFIKELRYEKGRESGFNIKEQIDTFKEFKRKNPEKDIAKVLVIIQGWSLEDYNEYARGIFSVFEEMDEELREDYYSYIGGISLGTSGIISYFRMFDLYCRAPNDLTEIPEQFRSFIHILGLGGNNKSGVLFALQDNFFGKKVHYTFDSTTLTSASTFGRYTELTEREHARDGEIISYNKQPIINLGRKLTPKVKKFVAEIQDEFEDLIIKNLGIGPLSRDEFRNKFSPWSDDNKTGIKDFENAHGGKGCPIAREDYNNAISLNAFLHFALEAKTFMIVLDEMKNGDFHSISDKEYRKAMQLLSTIPTHKEYMKRRNEFKRILGFVPERGSEEEEYHLSNPGSNPNKNEKRKSKMTYCQTVAEFEMLCEESLKEQGLDISEYDIYDTETRELSEEHIEELERLRNPKIVKEVQEIAEDEW